MIKRMTHYVPELYFEPIFYAVHWTVHTLLNRFSHSMWRRLDRSWSVATTFPTPTVSFFCKTTTAGCQRTWHSYGHPSEPTCRPSETIHIRRQFQHAAQEVSKRNQDKEKSALTKSSWCVTVFLFLMTSATECVITESSSTSCIATSVCTAHSSKI